MEDKKPHILIISTSPLSYTETFIKAHVELLDGKIFNIYGWGLDYNNSDGISLRDLYSVKTYRKWFSLLPHFLFFRMQQESSKKNTNEMLIKRYLKDNKIDVVLAEYGMTGSFITPICREVQIPLIVHFHGIDASSYEILERFKEGYQNMFDYATWVIGVSKRMVNDIVKMGCPKKKVVYNLYGPNRDFCDVRPNYQSNNIIAVGHQNFKKAPYLTILAFHQVLKKHPNLKLHFAGGGELLEVSMNTALALGIENQVIFHGKLQRSEVLELIKKSFLFVQHSIIAMDGNSEGTPVAILESMMAGLPVVSTIHAGIPDVVLNNETGILVNEKDVDAMAEAITKIVEDRALAEKMGQAGRQRALARFEIEQHIQKLNQLIKEI